MRRVLAYSPAVALFAAGIVAVLAIPPMTHETLCCPAGPAENAPCPQCAGVSVSYPGVLVLLATWAAALAYALAMFGLRHWSSIELLQSDP